MTQIHESRSSSHPLIDRVWRSSNISDGTYLATPDGSWDLIVLVGSDGRRSMMIAGQATKATHVPYSAGTSSVVISFAAGAYLPDFPGDTLINAVEMLPSADDDHFVFADILLSFPTYENAEMLVDRMVQLSLIASDDVVDSLQKGTPKATSSRAAQRHFLKTTGTTKKQLDQIERAQKAVKLLQQGKKPIEAATDAGYTDQSHLAKSLRKIMNAKPSNVDDIHKL